MDTTSPEQPPTAPEAPPAPEKPSLKRRALSLAKDLSVALAVFLAVSLWQQRDLVSTSDGPLPELALTTLDGQPVNAEALKGKAVQLHFWATWCGVCRQEFGALNQLQSELGEDQRLVAVVLESGSEEDIRSFVKAHDIRYPVAIGDRATQEAWRIHSFPTSYYLSPDAEIASRDVGLASRWGMKLRLWWSAVGT